MPAQWRRIATLLSAGVAEAIITPPVGVEPIEPRRALDWTTMTSCASAFVGRWNDDLVVVAWTSWPDLTS
jgi:hypothetical protein